MAVARGCVVLIAMNVSTLYYDTAAVPYVIPLSKRARPSCDNVDIVKRVASYRATNRLHVFLSPFLFFIRLYLYNFLKPSILHVRHRTKFCRDGRATLSFNVPCNTLDLYSLISSPDTNHHCVCARVYAMLLSLFFFFFACMRCVFAIYVCSLDVTISCAPTVSVRDH